MVQNADRRPPTPAQFCIQLIMVVRNRRLVGIALLVALGLYLVVAPSEDTILSPCSLECCVCIANHVA